VLVIGVNPTSIALEDTSIYFTNAASLPYELDRTPLSGGAKTRLASNNSAMNSLIRYATYPYSMLVDQSRLYFTNDESDGLSSATLTGEAATTLIAANVNRDSLAIATGQLYFQMGPDLVTMPTAAEPSPRWCGASTRSRRSSSTAGCHDHLETHQILTRNTHVCAGAI
jgi:hypothetical protein